MQSHFYEEFLLFGYSLSKLFTCKLKQDDLLISTKQFHQFLQLYIQVLQLTTFVNSPFYYNNLSFVKWMPSKIGYVRPTQIYIQRQSQQSGGLTQNGINARKNVSQERTSTNVKNALKIVEIQQLVLVSNGNRQCKLAQDLQESVPIAVKPISNALIGVQMCMSKY